ncbi:inositol monophosphatase family protein [Consotaella salsifontis]|uniref:Myo-inositol-1(Or 4)-monophosphatase n=1 Tax=Consotaella salsifontis TaxID=1365950 RepID=A0A1T4PY28_9HYPH|nr:3'(2'),5'-bisphosphate nucleotidase CysQ [Consotaella salsifontis]SJZ96444.1 myo-inositol-1(or 4)-monophosphatase [Consotaella salsifontis]
MDAPRDDEDLALIVDAARRASAVANGFFRKEPRVWYKAGNSPVSEADIAVDRLLKSLLLDARPGYGWVSEEAEHRLGGSTGRFFIVDPIDGTRAYLRGETSWCISIAVVDGARPVAGVVYAPALDHEVTATRTGPALLNGAAVTAPAVGEKLRVACPDRIRQSLAGVPTADIDFRRSLPSLAYRLAMVAMGELDGTLIRPRANDWDIAAADLILERAGGALLDAGGGMVLYNIEGRRHGLLIAAAQHALTRLKELGHTAAQAADLSRG